MIIGHQKQIGQIQQLINNNLLPQTLLFSGTSGIGKKLIASKLAKTLLCSQSNQFGGCDNCESCTKFDNQASPDYHYWDASDKEYSKPEDLRLLLKDLSLTSFAGGNRILIIDNAESLSNSSANILLKSLEEPRDKLYYILVSSNAATLPITILSRCQKIVFNDLDKTEIKELINQLGTEYFENLKPEDLAKVENLDVSSISAIRQIDENYQLWQDSKELFQDLIQGKESALLSKLKPLTKEREKLSSLIFFLIILARHFHQKLIKEEKPDQIIEKWAIIINNLIDSHYFILSRNINAYYLLSDILIDINKDYAESIETYLL